MAHWDVFHADRLEVERSLTTDEVRDACARGAIRVDDLARPAGTSIPWARLGDLPILMEAGPAAPPPPPPIPAGPEARAEADPAGLAGEAPGERFPLPRFLDDFTFDPDDPEEADAEVPVDADETLDAILIDDNEDLDGPEDDADETLDAILIDDEEDDIAEAARHRPERAEAGSGRGSGTEGGRVAPPAFEAVDDEGEDDDPQDEDDEAAEFTLSRGGPERVEELDLAAMVDVAFQLVLFFLVTATTVLYKSLEVPKPNPDSPAAAAAQGRSRSLDDLKDDYILVEIDPTGALKIDREPVPSEMPAIVERLRQARERTDRKAMLLSADFATPHRSAVMAYDAANEIGLGIAIARPSNAPPETAPAPPKPGAPAAPRAGG